MSTPMKSSSLQAYRLMLYNRALHPELFSVKARRTIEYGEYEFECWVTPGGHVLRFQHGGECGTELVTFREDGIPERGLAAALPCAGEREHEEQFGKGIKYLASVQTEQLPEALFKDTYAELIDFARRNEGVVYEWLDEDEARNASIIDLQRFRNEVHIQAYHLLGQGGVVLRTQSIFEILPQKD